MIDRRSKIRGTSISDFIKDPEVKKKFKEFVNHIEFFDYGA